MPQRTLDIGDENVEYIDHMGSDARVVNCARVSLARQIPEDILSGPDERLIHFLVENEHTAPFRHCFMTVRITAPNMIKYQWMTHHVGCIFDEIESTTAINTVSGRYVQYKEKFWLPPNDGWREAGETIKQGSLATLVPNAAEVTQREIEILHLNYEHYLWKIEQNVCKEQARSHMPASLMTEFYFTASLQAWLHFVHLRYSSHAQYEIQLYAEKILDLLHLHFPVSTAAFRQKEEA